MRAPRSLPRLPIGLLAALLLLAGCGRAAPGTAPGATGSSRVAVADRVKPGAALGLLDVAVVDRPAPDRAVLEARLALAEGVPPCHLVLVLPDGAWRVSGPARIEAADGKVRWEVGFLDEGRALDATVRLESAPGAPPCGQEAYARLLDGAPGR